jgi:hypothetical protein
MLDAVSDKLKLQLRQLQSQLAESNKLAYDSRKLLTTHFVKPSIKSRREDPIEEKVVTSEEYKHALVNLITQNHVRLV